MQIFLDTENFPPGLGNPGRRNQRPQSTRHTGHTGHTVPMDPSATRLGPQALGSIDCELIRGPCGQGIPAPVQAMGSGSGVAGAGHGLGVRCDSASPRYM